MARYKIDWRLGGGFAALLFLIVAIGLIGIIQIKSLGRTVDELGGRYFPIQQAALEMRINNSLYAKGIRNYVFWHSSKYLEAARAGASLEEIKAALGAFERSLASYASIAISDLEMQWIKRISLLQQELRLTGERIIDSIDRIEDMASGPKRKELEEMVNRQLMSFENRLYRIDDFLDANVQKANLEAVREQLENADLAQARALALLRWSLILALLIGGETAGFVYSNRRRDRERRQQLMHRMIALEEEERRNLSLQVHDQMGQDLSALKIYLDLTDRKLLEAKEDAKRDLTEGKRILDGLIERSHNIAELLRPPALDEIGLVETIDSLILQYKQMSSIKFIYQKPKSPVRLSGEHSLVLYRLTQEGLTNVLKHAQAKKVKVELELLDKAIRLSIEDDGVGFDYKNLLKRLRRRKEDRVKLGLLGLKERVELLGGSLDIRTAAGAGTRLVAQLPYLVSG